MDSNEGKKPENGIPGKTPNNGHSGDSNSAYTGRIIEIPELCGEGAFEDYFRSLTHSTQPSSVSRNQVRLSMNDNEDQELNRAGFNHGNANNLAWQNYSNATHQSSDGAAADNMNPPPKQPLLDSDDDEDEMIAVFVDDLIRLQKASIPEETNKTAENVDGE